jgi:ABC-2 type transport system ATP-binding protein
VIRARALHHGYVASHPVLRGVDLELSAGLTLLVGQNGAGKSTLLRLLAGVERPEGGRVEIDGVDLWRDEAAARRRLAYLPERPELDPYVTVGEAVRLVAGLFDRPPAAVAAVLARVGVAELGPRTVEELSLGQRRRVHLALAMISDAPNLLLDEPLETLDAGGRALVLEWIDQRLAGEATVLVASHVLEPFLPRASLVLRLERGRAEVHRPAGLEPVDDPGPAAR